MSRTTMLPPLLAGVLLLSACSGGDTNGSDQGSGDADGPAVEVTNNEFSPESLEIEVGETVTWEFVQGAHNVIFDDVESDVLSRDTWQRTFDEVGTFDYVCTLHTGMSGTIVVQDAA